MSNGPTGDWENEEKKRDAIIRVMRYIIANPGAGQACVGNDAAARQLFENPGFGNVKVPPQGRVVIFDPGEEHYSQAAR